MNFSSSFKKSFKSHGSYKHSRRISIENGDDPVNEEQPILSDQYNHPNSMTNDHHEVIVKVDGCDQDTASERDAEHNGNNSSSSNNKIWREISYESWNDGNRNMSPSQHGFEFQRGNIQDPPSQLIGQFLNKQRDAGLEMSLDMELEMHELRDGGQQHNRSSRNLTNDDQVSTSRDLKVSFQAPSFDGKVVDIATDEQHRYGKEENIVAKSSSSDEHGDGHDEVPRHSEYQSRRISPVNINNDADEDQVLRCTSFQKRASMLRLKTKSRLLDPSPERPEIKAEMKSGRIGRSGVLKSGVLKSGVLKSGMLGRASGMLGKPVADEEEDDPLFDEDIPEEYKRAKFNVLTLAQCLGLILIVTTFGCTLAIPEWKAKKFRGLELWKWEVLVLVLISGRLVSGWGVRIVVFCIERNFLLRKRVLYFVYGVRKAVQNCIWLGLVLIAWHSMFDRKVEGNNKFLSYVNKLMLCMLVATLLWLVKTLMVKVLASSFHVSTFFDRIQESLFNQYVIETLSGPPVIEIQHIQEEEERTFAEVRKLQNAGATLPPELRPPGFDSIKSSKAIGSGGLPPRPTRGLSLKISGPITSKKQQDDPGITIDHLHRLNPKNISAWNMKRLMNIVRHGALSTLDEQIMDTSHQDESATQINSEFEAKVAARKVFRNVAKPRARFIHLQDLMRFLREEEALKTLNLIEGSSESEKISKASLKNWVINAFRERRALALTLNDTKTAVNKLHRMVNVLVAIIIGIIWVLILEIATSKILLLISSQIVVAAFMFGNTCKTIFESIIFLFVMHPFDVGDRCEVDGIQLIVEEMNIFTTIFLRGSDNQRIMYPNSTLSTKAIHNYYRSPDMWDIIYFYIHVATPPEKIAVMKQRIISHIESKKDYWYPAPLVLLMYIDDLHKLKMSVWVRHKMNHQDMTERWIRRGILCEEMVRICKELDIDYRFYPIDINIRSMPSPTLTRGPSTWANPAN